MRSIPVPRRRSAQKRNPVMPWLPPLFKTASGIQDIAELGRTSGSVPRRCKRTLMPCERLKHALMDGIEFQDNFMKRITGTSAKTTTLGEVVNAFVPYPLPPAAPALAPDSFTESNRQAELVLAR